MVSCRFCDLADKPFLETEHYRAVIDQNPVTKGHVVLILKRHEPSLFNVTATEWADLQNVLAKSKSYLDSEYQPAGYNVGVNVDEAGGQSVPHLHIHLFPRYIGDVENPRGGIRHFIKPITELPAEYT